MDPEELHWRTNSSFSPPPRGIWDCRLHSDSLPHGSYGTTLNGSSHSTNSRRSKSRIRCEQYGNHHLSISDGVLSYSSSPPDNARASQWTSPIPKVNPEGFASTDVGGSISQTFWLPCSAEAPYLTKTTTASPGFGSFSSLSDFSHMESARKQLFSFTNQNFAGRRPYMSRAVYPLVFRNPVSECEVSGEIDSSSIDRLTPTEEPFSPFHWTDDSSNAERKFQKTLSELQRSEASPDHSVSSIREGFRWSNASSYDPGLDGERIDIPRHMDVENLKSPNGPLADQKCGVCMKFLWQRSPWSSNRIVQGGDMPTAGVLSCSHIFHAECLEQSTPKSQIHDPPCPLCLKTVGEMEEPQSISEPLQMALRSLRRSRGVMFSEAQENDSASDNTRERLRTNWPQAAPGSNDSSPSIKNRLKKHFTFRGKMSRDIFSSKVVHNIGSSSSGREPVRRRIST